jgi:hypothetical protein
VTRYRTSFDTDQLALVEELFLGLMAPGKSEAAAAAMLTEEITTGMDGATVEKVQGGRARALRANAEWGMRT